MAITDTNERIPWEIMQWLVNVNVVSKANKNKCNYFHKMIPE